MDEPRTDARPPRRPLREFPFASLLLTLLGYIMVQTVVDAGGPLAPLLSLAATALVIATALTLIGRTGHFLALVMLAAAAAAARLAYLLLPETWLAVLGSLLTAFFLGCYLYAILRVVLADGVITDQRIMGALSGYLLLGVAWSFLHVAVEAAMPGSYRAGGAPVPGGASARIASMPALYYSFITLTTIGYGDIVPVARLSQTLAWLEGVAGQIYLAVLVARLVGLQITRGAQSQP